MKVAEILQEAGIGKAANIQWPKENYAVYLVRVPWSHESREGLKVIKTSIEKMQDFYEERYLQSKDNMYDSPLVGITTNFHFSAPFRKRFNQLLNSQEGGVIMPTGMYRGLVLSYANPRHALALAREAHEKAPEAEKKYYDKKEKAHRKHLDKEKKRKASEEKRIPTGVRNTTVIDPSSFDKITSRGWKDLEVYSGSPSGINLGTVQERNYDALSDALARNGKKFNYVGYAQYEGAPAYNSPSGNAPTLFRFVMTAPGFVWEKYEGDTAGGGQNRVYVGGQAMKLTAFLGLSPKKQDALIQAK